MKQFFKLLISGICVGAADLVPGISGGTVAFIIGIYEELLQSISSCNINALKLLFKGQIKAFYNAIPWRFLLPVIGGVALSFLTLAKLFTFLLNHELYRIFLYSGFLGLVLGSAHFCSRLISSWNSKKYLLLFVGGVIAWICSGHAFTATSSYQVMDIMPFIDPWVFLCGVLAVSAMLLPGISGSYLLTILGMYRPILQALLGCIVCIQNRAFDPVSFKIIGSMLLGIGFGAVTFSKVVSYFLKNYREATLSLLIGFMLGALRAVWPFWIYAPRAASSDHLEVISPVLPDVTSLEFYWSLLFFALGLAAVFFVEFIASKKERQIVL